MVRFPTPFVTPAYMRCDSSSSLRVEHIEPKTLGRDIIGFKEEAKGPHIKTLPLGLGRLEAWSKPERGESPPRKTCRQLPQSTPATASERTLWAN